MLISIVSCDILILLYMVVITSIDNFMYTLIANFYD